MTTTEKIIISSVIGTSFMTLYSYLKGQKEREKYSEPELLNESIDNSKYLPDINNKKYHPVGWILHYGTGVSFVAAYRIFWNKALEKPSAKNILMLGSLSGIAGIAVWKTIFSKHENPPKNNRSGYFKQLFIAHLVFSATAISSYKRMNKLRK